MSEKEIMALKVRAESIVRILNLAMDKTNDDSVQFGADGMNIVVIIQGIVVATYGPL